VTGAWGINKSQTVEEFFDNMRRMFDELRYRYRRRHILKTFEPLLRKAHKLKNIDDLESLRSEQSSELDMLDAENDSRRSWQLIRKAESLDISRPAYGDESWEEMFTGGMLLKPEARHKLRQQVDSEVTRRREVRAWWWKSVVIPAITALTGLAGVITGMIAVIHSKK
jgi:hypothetical protein